MRAAASRRAPEPILKQREVLPAARRTHVLVVLAAAKLVTNADVRLDALQIGDLHGGGEGLVAARTSGLLARGAGLADHVDAELHRPLHDMKELAEGRVK